jgi:hypothetical protein
MSEEWRDANAARRQRDLIRGQGVASFPKDLDIKDRNTANAYKKHLKEHSVMNSKRGESTAVSRPAQKKADTTVVAGQRMKTRNAEKSFAYVGGYRQGGAFVSKKAMKSQGPKAVTDALKGQMVSPKKLRQGASRYDAEFGTPKRVQTEAYIQGVKSGHSGQSMWTIHKNKNRANGF